MSFTPAQKRALVIVLVTLYYDSVPRATQGATGWISSLRYFLVEILYE